MNRVLSPPVAVLVVDDQQPFLAIARAMLDDAAGFRVVGEATTGEEAVESAIRLRPALVLMDVLLPGMDGPEAARRIRAAVPGTVVVLASASRREELDIDLERCGAVAFLQKEDVAPEVLAGLL